MLKIMYGRLSSLAHYRGNLLCYLFDTFLLKLYLNVYVALKQKIDSEQCYELTVSCLSLALKFSSKNICGLKCPC